MTRHFNDDAPSDVHFILENTIQGDDVALKDLNRHNDNFIVFRAVDVNSTEALVLTTASRTPSSAREPLQPVNRQLAAESLPTSEISSETTPGCGEKVSAVDENGATMDENTFRESPAISSFPNQASFESLGHHYLSPLRQAILRQSFHAPQLQQSQPPLPTLTPDHVKPEHIDEHARPQYEEYPGQYGHATNESQPPPKLESGPVLDFPERSPTPDRVPHDFLVTSDSQDQEPLFNVDYLQSLMGESSPELLELAVKKGMQIIASIREPIVNHSHGQADTEEWLSQIDALRMQAMQTRTVVGVVGNTGAGKSSVINALLDEERLVPTNCMRACTAVVTEISWNQDNDPNKKYKAEIEFISAADWEKELGVLFNDMCDGSGQFAKDCTNPDTEAGIAYAKVRSVYPQMTREELLETVIPNLLNKHGVKKVLGTTLRFVDPQPNSFYRCLQKYVDSNEKEDRPKGVPKPMEYWPLIKCVKIYTRSDALSTGAVIVDLPGVQDSNAARAAVAEGYMKQCSGLWIVAPINRAVNDKAAKKLLGDQFKRQMKYDGMFSNVTFICSKTDDISITEAADSLGIEGEVQGSWDEINKLEKDKVTLKEKIQELDGQYDVYGKVFNDQDELIEVWEKLQDKIDSGSEVYAPRENSLSKKRKRSGYVQSSRKHINLDSDAESDDDVASNHDDSDEENPVTEDDEVRGVPLSSEQIKAKLDDCKQKKKEARKQKTTINSMITGVKQEIKQINEKIKDIKADIGALCIAGRNEFSKSKIQDDYAQGIKELDQENAIEEDEENFDPDVDIRDYEKIAKSLPVFCVSSRAYQKMCGRLKKDGKVLGFKTPEQTEVPQLKVHCKKLTEAGRTSSCRVFLNSLSRLLLSISLWSGNDGSGIKLTDEQHIAEVQQVKKRLHDLELAFDKAVESCTKDIKETLEDNIYQLFPVAISTAEQAAFPVASRWGSHRDQGGLWYATYKAVCRRSGGPFTGSGGPHDFNKQLSEPMEKYLVSGWERCFQRRMPAVFKAFHKDMGLMLRKFHASIEERARLRGTGVAGLHILSSKLPTLEAKFGELSAQLTTVISDKQKEANRELTPVIANLMQRAYDLCTNESGTCTCFLLDFDLCADLL
jgi:hypothetical protein